MTESNEQVKQVQRRCFRCDGTGLICDICGESEAACNCLNEGEDPTYSDCEDCAEAEGRDG